MISSLAPPVYSVIPFVVMLLAIATGPLWLPHWWERNSHKLLVGVVLGAPVLLLYLFRRPAALIAMAEDYASFIVLLAALYAISAGIRLTGDLEATLAEATQLGATTVIPPMPIPNGPTIAMIADPQGHLFGAFRP